MTNLCISHWGAARRLSGLVLFATFCVLPSTTGLLAQSGTSSALSGVVSDNSGAVIPAATVSAVEIETKATRNAQTNAHGAFLFLQINPGTYEVSVKADGFAAQRSRPTVVPVGRTVSLNFTLQVSSSSQTVTVEARQGLAEPGQSEHDDNAGFEIDQEPAKSWPGSHVHCTVRTGCADEHSGFVE